MGGRRERDWTKNIYDWPTDMDNSVGIDCGSGGGMCRGGQRGKIGTTVIE